MAAILAPHLTESGLVGKALEFASHQVHIMDFIRSRCLMALFSMINQIVRNCIDQQQQQFEAASSSPERYVLKSLLIAIVWSFSGDGKLSVRKQLGDFLVSQLDSDLIDIPAALESASSSSASLIDYEVAAGSGEWLLWSNKVPRVDIEPNKIAGSDVVIPTVDTVRHESLLYTWLAEHKPLLLCGPPGSVIPFKI